MIPHFEELLVIRFDFHSVRTILLILKAMVLFQIDFKFLLSSQSAATLLRSLKFGQKCIYLLLLVVEPVVLCTQLFTLEEKHGLSLLKSFLILDLNGNTVQRILFGLNLPYDGSINELLRLIEVRHPSDAVVSGLSFPLV